MMFLSIQNAYMSGHVIQIRSCLFCAKRVQHMFGRMWEDRNFDGEMQQKYPGWSGICSF